MQKSPLFMRYLQDRTDIQTNKGRGKYNYNRNLLFLLFQMFNNKTYDHFTYKININFIKQ